LTNIHTELLANHLRTNLSGKSAVVTGWKWAALDCLYCKISNFQQKPYPKWMLGFGFRPIHPGSPTFRRAAIPKGHRS